MHPIYAIILLVIIICQIALLLFMFNIEFLSLLLVIVYAGAIAVLFLFVIMMLNIKITQQVYTKKFFLFSFIFGFIIIVFYCLFKLKFYTFNHIKLIFYSNFNFKISNTDIFNNLDILGQLIFSNYIICILFIGLALLIPLIGSITLTFNCENTKNKNFNYYQLSRSYNTLSFIK
jgi:NADH-quinone oxidoreductase subunit J